MLRASTAAPISVDRVAERAATLVWTSPTTTSAPAAFAVHYAPHGAVFQSRRTVAHRRVTLHNLRPGTQYDVRVVGGLVDSTASFTTAGHAAASACADSPDSVAAIPAPPLTELSRLEIRVGKVLECGPHPDADTLYVEKVDVGEDEPRTIVSGLVKFVAQDDMVGRSVVVLCNLKPRAMRGVLSHGMLLCASNEDHTQVDPLAAPDGAPLGELVTFEGHRTAPIDPGNRATKAFDRVADSLRTSDDGIARFDDVPFETSAGPCLSPNKLVGSVS